MKKRWLIGAAAIILALGSISYYFQHRKSTVPMKMVKVVQGSISEKAIAIGQILPEHSVKVKSQVSGIVASLLHREGDYVAEGQVLVQIQPTPSPERYDDLRRTVEIKRVTEQARKAELAMIQGAFVEHAIDKLKYNQAKESYHTALLERQKAEEQLALVEQGKIAIGERQISNEIKSPISGHIIERGINEGDPVVGQSDMQPGDVLFTLADMQHLLFRGEVNELDAVKLKEGMPATLTIGALPDVTIKGRVMKIALQSEQASSASADQKQLGSNPASTSKFNVGFKIEIGNLQIPANIQLKSGYSATAEIIIKQANNALLIPERLLIFKDDKPYVQLPSAEEEPKLQMIKTGISDGINVQVLEGLQLGQEIVDKSSGKTASD